jgi:hypothetical protein
MSVWECVSVLKHEKEVLHMEYRSKEILEYEAPRLVTYHEDDLLEHLGPAQACSPDPCPVP